MFNEWYLARDEGWAGEAVVRAYPTGHSSIVKRRGCIEYFGKMVTIPGGRIFHSSWALSPRDSKKIFGHCPKKGELLCVKKTRTGWKAEKIDLEFS